MMQYLKKQEHDMSDHTLSSILNTHDFTTDIFVWLVFLFIHQRLYTVYITWEITYRYKNTGSFFFHHTKHGSFITEIHYLSEHPVTAAMLNTVVEETHCIMSIGLLKSLQFHVAAY